MNRVRVINGDVDVLGVRRVLSSDLYSLDYSSGCTSTMRLILIDKHGERAGVGQILTFVFVSIGFLGRLIILFLTFTPLYYISYAGELFEFTYPRCLS